MNRRNFLKRLGLALVAVPAIKLGVKSKEAKADGSFFHVTGTTTITSINGYPVLMTATEVIRRRREYHHRLRTRLPDVTWGKIYEGIK